VTSRAREAVRVICPRDRATEGVCDVLPRRDAAVGERVGNPQVTITASVAHRTRSSLVAATRCVCHPVDAKVAGAQPTLHVWGVKYSEG